MVKVSLTLPSINQKLCEIAVKKILETTRDVDYEIVVVSPFEIHAPKVRWIHEAEQMGNCAAHTQASLHSSGEIIVAFTDDREPSDPYWLKNAHDFYLNRSKLFFPYACGLNQGAFHIAYGRLYPCFPVISRQSIERVGTFYDPQYGSDYGDPDLGLRVWEAGGRCEHCPGARINVIRDRLGVANPKEQEPSSRFQNDHQVFIKRWHHVYGNGWGTDPSDFNKNLQLRFLRDFGFCEPNPAIVDALIRRRDRQRKIANALFSLARHTGFYWPLRKSIRLLRITFYRPLRRFLNMLFRAQPWVP